MAMENPSFVDVSLMGHDGFPFLCLFAWGQNMAEQPVKAAGTVPEQRCGHRMATAGSYGVTWHRPSRYVDTPILSIS